MHIAQAFFYRFHPNTSFVVHVEPLHLYLVLLVHSEWSFKKFQQSFPKTEVSMGAMY